ncbi:MAG: hypothetical protein ABMA25_27840, partial [Ilumatobacteraceae bacterium]
MRQVEPAPKPARKPRSSFDDDSIAQRIRDDHEWHEVLADDGWQLVTSNAAESKWTRPGKEARHGTSAVLHEPDGPFNVFTSSMPDLQASWALTKDGCAWSFSIFGYLAATQYGGDRSALAREYRKTITAPDASALNTTTTSTPSVVPAEASDDPKTLPAAFWTARPLHAHARQAAHARGRSADAVFAVVLARVAALTPPSYALPAIVGSAAPLNMFVALVGGAGSGKSTAKSIACELLPYDGTDIADDFPLGSGEGLTELYFDMVDEKVNGKTKPIKRQTRRGAFMFLDEGQALAAMSARAGTTLAPTLRTAWSGQMLGSANASKDTKRQLRAGSYALGLVIGFQPELAGELLADSIGGTPQRFLWIGTEDPTIPDDPPPWPGALCWQPPPLRHHGGVSFPTLLTVDPTIAAEVRNAQLAVSRGMTKPRALDEHANLMKLKVAGLLAVLDDRTDINLDDWQLAGLVMKTSNAVRAVVQAAVSIDQRKAQERY